MPGKNGGRLLAGGKPGNRGGGRTPDVIRQLFRDKLAPHVDTLDDFAAGRVRVLLGFEKTDELAQRCYQLHAEAQARKAGASRYQPWKKLDQDTRDLWVEVAEGLRGNGKLTEMIVEAAGSNRVRAIEAMAKVGMPQNVDVEVKGEVVGRIVNSLYGPTPQKPSAPAAPAAPSAKAGKPSASSPAPRKKKL